MTLTLRQAPSWAQLKESKYMLLKVGELAKRSGVTVRTLHHYDRIGLLKPSARSDSGYRLYNRTDIARLHQVQALQRLGLTLADIGTALTSPDSQLPNLVARQLDMLTRQIEQASLLRDRLRQMHQQLLQGDEPELTDWLKTLELMTMYDKYFSAAELKQMPFLAEGAIRHTEWETVAQTVRDLISKNVPHDSAAAQQVAAKWFAIVEQEIIRDPRLRAKLTDMHYSEPLVQEQTGISTEMIHYIQHASTHAKLAIYKKYLNPDEFAYVEQNYSKRITEWPSLIANLYRAMESDTPVTTPEVQQLARHWLALFRAYVGDNPDTQLKIRTAHEREPALLAGSSITPELLTYVRAAFAHLQGLSRSG